MSDWNDAPLDASLDEWEGDNEIYHKIWNI